MYSTWPVTFTYCINVTQFRFTLRMMRLEPPGVILSDEKQVMSL